MHPQVNSKATGDALDQVAKDGLLRVNFDVVKTVALYVWYGSEVCDLSRVQGPYQKDALFLVERLAYYNLVPQPRKKALLEQVRRAGGSFGDLDNEELEGRFNDFLPDLQPLQSRHFAGNP